MNKLLVKVIIQERLSDNSVQTIQSLVFTESLDRLYAASIAVFHVLQAHSRVPVIRTLSEIDFDDLETLQFTVNENFIVRVESMMEVTEEQIQFLGAVDILGYNLGTSRIKNHLPESITTLSDASKLAVVA